MTPVETVKTIQELRDLAVDGIKTAKDLKSGNVLDKVRDLFRIMNDVQKLMVDAPQALPELATLDAAGAAQVGAAAFDMVRAIADAVKAA